MELLFYGSRRMVDWLGDEGHRVYSYLLRNLNINRPNQVWATDITYLPMARGFVYLVAVIDGYSRRVLTQATRIQYSVEINLPIGFQVDRFCL